MKEFVLFVWSDGFLILVVLGIEKLCILDKLRFLGCERFIRGVELWERFYFL